MNKSTKRLKLEKEIFSTSILDIEKMFSFHVVEDEERVHKKPLSHSTIPLLLLSLLLPLLKNSRLDVVFGNVLAKTNFDYDCVNLSLIDEKSDQDQKEESLEKKHLMKPPILPSSTLIPDPGPAISYDHNISLSLPLDLFFYEDEETDIRHEVDRKFGCNLERDLKIIDQMFILPLQTSS